MPPERPRSARNEETTGRSRVQPAIYKGPLPDLPTQPAQPRRIADAAEIEAMQAPRERAQQPLVKAADQLKKLVDERQYGGFAHLALEHDPPSVVLLWKGPLPQPVEHLVDELRPAVRVVVRDAAHSLDELLEEARRIIALDRARIGVTIWKVGPLNDSSGLKVAIDQTDDLARAKREIRSPIKLEFVVSDPIILASQ